MKMMGAIALAVLLAPSTVGAVEWHVAIGGVAELDDRGPASAGVEPDGEAGWTVAGGVTHDSGLGVEAGFVDLGRLEADGVADSGYTTDGELWSVGVTYAPDTGDLQPYAKLGWFWRDEDGSRITIAGPQPLVLDDDGVMAEVGGRWRVTDEVALRLGYVWYDFDGQSDGNLQLLAEWRF